MQTPRVFPSRKPIFANCVGGALHQRAIFSGRAAAVRANVE
jgi:hypothetical protein